ncbi:hypothetical protein CAPTEDRAFT_126662 [Capitella teleta]|uniref:Small ribosomal subunit protein mS33 n=1 Tax=Capitella teleta TaxID=283909 RepID=R7TY19_CAPTE|nr:hypothetical protein CAPTEDRAFT_126662 [Capitella teleta]|eukprot:ELT95850.1 hypothetical protein CAPTEDRAFT_126662 [Capitella teleta]
MSEYSRRMGILGARIFGEVVRPTNKQSMKVVNMFAAQPNQKNEAVCEYYPRHNQIFWLMRNLRNMGLYRDEHQDFKEETLRKRALRGKSKPAKGEGKRSQKKK